MKRKHNVKGVGKGLSRALIRLDRIGKSESTFFFGGSIDKVKPYEPSKETFADWERAADDMFGLKRKKNVLMVEG